MKNLFRDSSIALMLLTALIAYPPVSEANVAAGLHYHQIVTDIADVEGFDSPVLGILMAFSFGPPLINFEFDLEFLPKYGFSSGMIQPSVFIFTGSSIYGGIGTGIGLGGGVASGGGVSHAQDSPFLAFRAGVKLTRFDLFVTYRQQAFNSGASYNVQNDDLDSLTLGALYRF